MARAPPGRGRAVPAGHGAWHCRSVIDRQAAEAVSRLLRAAETRSGGASIKSLTLAPHVVHKKATFAVTCQTLKYLPLLKELLAAARILERFPQLPEAAACVLAYEMLLGQGMRKRGPGEHAMSSARGDMRSELARMLQTAGAKDVDALLEQRASSNQGCAAGVRQPLPPRHPRWVRVNTLKLGMQEALERLRADPRTAAAEPDDLLPDLLRLPPGTDLHDHPLVADGRLILQSKASCMPAHALAPAAGWTVLDACAAPGNKTTHAAARVGRRGRVLAFDRDAVRLARLVDNVRRAGAAGVVSAECADFVSLDPRSPRFAEARWAFWGDGPAGGPAGAFASGPSWAGGAGAGLAVRGIILDPSCSGSGTGVSRMDHLLPQATGRGSRAAGGVGGGSVPDNGGEDGCGRGGAAEAQRVEQLARFQEAALRHALRFPGAVRVAYSTCSVHARENEAVVAAALPAALAAGFDLVDPFPGGRWRRRGLPGSLPGGRAARVVRVDPREDGTDGFFVAVFERPDGSGGGGDGGGGRSGGGDDGSGGGGGKSPASGQQQRQRRQGNGDEARGPRKRNRRKSSGGLAAS